MLKDLPQGKESNIIIYCSDPRVVKWLHNNEVQKKLSIGVGYSSIANTGSIKFYLNENLMNKLFKQLGILIGHFQPEKIILLNHTGCGYYKSIDEDREEIQTADLKKVHSEISTKFPSVKIESWLIETESGELREVK